MKIKTKSDESEQLMDVVRSLKRYSRHDLKALRTGEHDDVIELLYCDPRGNDITLRQFLGPEMTFLIGRRGTGKSTILDRAQHELRKSGNMLGCYINLKDILEDSRERVPPIPAHAAEHGILIDQELWNKYAVKGSLIYAVLKELGGELKKRASDNVWLEIWRKLSGQNTNSLLEELDEINSRLSDADYTDVTFIREVSLEQKEKNKDSRKTKVASKAAAKASGAAYEISAESKHGRVAERQLDEKFKNILVRVFKIRELLSDIKQTLVRYGITDLYLFFDDYSELSPADAQFITDVILQPLHQWDSFLKLKVAAYPNRIRWGGLDSTKVSRITLDWHEM